MEITEAEVSVFRAARVERAEFSFSATEDEEEMKDEEESDRMYKRGSTLRTYKS